VVATVDEELLEEAVEGGAGVPVRGREVQVLQVQHQVVGPRPGREGEGGGGWRPSGSMWGMCMGPAYPTTWLRVEQCVLLCVVVCPAVGAEIGATKGG